MIKRNKKGQFDRGNHSGRMFTSETSRGNQYAKGNPPNRTTWKKGDTAQSKHPQWKGGVQYTKRDGAFVSIGANKRKRRAVVNYENVYGPIPKGYVIYHKNGDKYDDSVDNLEAITRAELLARNNKR